MGSRGGRLGPVLGGAVRLDAGRVVAALGECALATDRVLGCDARILGDLDDVGLGVVGAGFVGVR